MHITRDIESLTHFKRNTNEVIERLKSTGAPLVLTVNGKAEIVVQDAASYQAMINLVERAEAVAGIKRGLESVEHAGGDSGRGGVRASAQGAGDPGRCMKKCRLIISAAGV